MYSVRSMLAPYPQAEQPTIQTFKQRGNGKGDIRGRESGTAERGVNLDHQVLVDVLCKGRRVRVKRRFCHIKVEGGWLGRGGGSRSGSRRVMSHKDDQNILCRCMKMS